MKKIGITFFIQYAVCFTAQVQNNPSYICKDCGTYDINRISFDENIDHLISKTPVNITGFTENFKEKIKNDISPSDHMIAFKYKVRNRLNENLGEGFFTFSTVFRFNNLSFLIDSQKKIVAYKCYTTYNGNEKEIGQLINTISKITTTKYTYNTLFADGSEIYQWDSQNYFYQLMKAKESKNSYYIGVISIKKDRMNSEIKKAIQNDETFLLFNEKGFSKK